MWKNGEDDRAEAIRGFRKTLLVLLNLAGTLGGVLAAPVQCAGQSHLALASAMDPSVPSSIGVRLSLIGMLTRRWRVRGPQSEVTGGGLSKAARST